MIDTTDLSGDGVEAPGMVPTMHLYIDDSGSRHLDRNMRNPSSHPRWFALGGVIVREEDIGACKTAHAAFLKRWPKVRGPFHISDMRSERKGFSWLERLDDESRTRFWTDYRALTAALPVAGIACVVDRPGYCARGYGQRNGDEKWLLCRSAFDIVVERAAKFAALEGRRLRVRFEGADPVTDARIVDYFRHLKAAGLGFNPQTSGKYNPLGVGELSNSLVDIERKGKRNVMMQFADTYVYALSRGGYDRKFDLYRRLLESGRLATSQVSGPKASEIGIKYYCFDHRRNK